MEEITQDIGSLNQLATPQRETEVARQMYRLNDTAVMLNKTAEELIQRLSSVLIPVSPQEQDKLAEAHPTTPLATNISEYINKLLEVEKKLRFIIKGCEL